MRPHWLVAIALLGSGCRNRSGAVESQPSAPPVDAGAPARAETANGSAPAPPGDALAAQAGPANGIFVNHLSREINLKILIVGAPGVRPQEVFDWLRAGAPGADATEVTDVPRIAGEAPQTVYRMYSFIPRGLAEIRGFRVRVHLAVLSGAPSPAQLDAALFGATSLLIVSPPGDAAPLLARIKSSPRYNAGARSVLLLEAPSAAAATSATIPGADVVLPTVTGAQDQVLPALKEALKLAIHRLTEPAPEPTEPLQAVPVPPGVDLLRLAEAKKGEPLTEAEVLDIRDHAPSIMLSASAAKKLEAQRGYPELDLERPWAAWQAIRARR